MQATGLQNSFCFGNPAVPVGPVAFPALPIQARRAPHQLQRAGVLRLLGVWLYRQTVSYLLSGLSKSKFSAKYKKMVKPIDLPMGLSNMDL